MSLVFVKFVLVFVLVIVCFVLIFLLKRTRSFFFCLEVRLIGLDDFVGGIILLFVVLVDVFLDEW